MALDFNPYKVLKVDPTADQEIITAVYRAMCKKYHPDVNKSPDAQARMQQINRAYDMLKDPAERTKIDADLAKSSPSSTSSSSTNSRTGSYTSSSSYNRYASSTSGSYNSASSSRTSSPSSTSSSGPFSSWSKRRSTTQSRQETVEPQEPTDNTLYLYQKRLVDDAQNKVLRVSVYHDKLLGGKVCNILNTARDKNGSLTTGSVFLNSPELFDLINDLQDAIEQINNTGQPLEMNSDHDVYFRRSVAGLSRTFIGIEVVKLTQDINKQGLFLIGEKKPSGKIEGVGSYQNLKQLAQCERIFKEALTAMR